MGEGLQGGTIRLTDKCFHQGLDVLHAVLHGCKQHSPQKTSVEQRPGPTDTHSPMTFINIMFPEGGLEATLHS